MASKGDNRDKEIATKLGDILAASYTLQIKTHNFHWNVTGPNFGTLHLLFENQYNELFAANDVIAERIRAVGEFAPGSLAAFQRRSEVEDAPDKPPAAEAMIATLVRDHETLSGRCGALRVIADDSDDTATGDLMNERMAAHDKHAWMLRSHLQ